MSAWVRRSARVAGSAALVAVLAGAAGCSAGGPRQVGASGIDGLIIPTPSPEAGDFVEGVDHPLMPLVPGSTWRYESRVAGELVETIEVRVSEEVRTVAGIPATVVHDVVTDAAGRVVEDGYDWFAQDAAGNVWYLGEDTTSYQDGRPSTPVSWEAGVDGATAGLAMPATPRVGDGYQQESSPGEAEDRALVLDVAASRTTAYGSFDDLLQTEQTTPLEPGLVEHRFYAPGVGLMLAEIVSGDEVVELVAHGGG